MMTTLEESLHFFIVFQQTVVAKSAAIKYCGS